jgi:TolB-like protein/Tfp pilus assembly protein PilF
MAEVDPIVVSLANAIADGQPIDWQSTDEAELSPDDRRLLAELRVIDSVHAIHRRTELFLVRSAGTGTTATDAPATWGHLEIRDIIGGGAYGVVYRAWDPHLASEVALKLLTRVTSAGSSVIQEASLLARVRHPNIVSIYGADRRDGKVGLWMELVRGRTLKEVVAERGTFGAREAALVGLDLTRALAAVHGAGLVHRDVKAQNVMREEGGRIVLMDFGAGVESATNAQPGLIGTPVYVAPEQFDRPGSTPQSDIYSLGVLLYHVVTGSFPVTADNLPAAEAAHKRGERRRLRDVRPDLPTEFVRIVERAMHPDVRDRYATAGELESDLVQFVVGEDRRAAGARQAAIRRALVSAIAALLLLVASVGAWRLWQNRSPGRPTAAGLRSLAVLPFENLTGDPAQDYFVDGMTDLLTDQLSAISSLSVTSRTSAMSVRGRRNSLAQIAKELRVDGVVEGSVARSGERIRVTVRVIHAGADIRLWGQSYEREAKDAFRLQAEIAQTIAGELRAALSESARSSVHLAVNVSQGAQDDYLRARYLMRTYNRDRLVEARNFLERAVATDPGFAMAWASLSRCYTLLENTGVLMPAEAATLARQAAYAALERDPGAFEAHMTLADVVFKFDWNWAEADAHYREAIRLNGNASLVRGQYAQFLYAAGRVDDAVGHARRGELTDPLSPEMKVVVAVGLYYKRQYQESLEKVAEALSLEPGLATAHSMRSRALSALGRFDEAIEEIRTSFDLTKDPAVLAELGRIFAEAGRSTEAQEILSRVQNLSTRGPAASLNQAYIEAALGRRDDALRGLARAVAGRTPRVLWMRVDPRVDPVRNTVEFQRLLDQIGGL